jgi:hypothetical protein
MHYKNGRVAKEGDSVIGKAYVGSMRSVAGTLHSTTEGCSTCNGQVAVPTAGGIVNTCVTIGEFLHADDGLAAYDIASGAILPTHS